MNKETLKALIEIEFDRSNNISEFKTAVYRLIDLYDLDTPPPYQVTINNIPDEVPYSDVCGCNPKNGGSGVCGCVMGRTMVPNPKKYGSTTKYSSTTSNRFL
jgi:hypothetical protein